MIVQCLTFYQKRKGDWRHVKSFQKRKWDWTDTCEKLIAYTHTTAVVFGRSWVEIYICSKIHGLFCQLNIHLIPSIQLKIIVIFNQLD